MRFISFRLQTAIFIAPALALFLLFFAVPSAAMLAEAFSDAGAAWRVLSDPIFWNSVIGSIFIGLAAPLLSLVVGTAVAITISRMPPRRSGWVLFAVSLPLTFSGLIVAYGFILLLGRAGFVTQILAIFGADPATVGSFIFSAPGLAVAYSYYLIPRVVLIVLPALRTFDAGQLAAARSLGAKPGEVLRHILLPQLAPSLATAFGLTAAVAIGAYGTALALTGTSLNILPLFLYSKISETGTDLPAAAVTSIVLMALCIAAICLAEIAHVFLTRRSRG
ncbi:ABC transporter permease subunit [Cereibacter sp. SYSU M97828]|nr:ABC transporter permease subunit [Cereibacter flavus]